MKDYLEIYCVTNKKLNFLEKSKYFLAGVGKENFSSDYIKSDNGQNIFHKEEFYSELTFHYWFWKNKLNVNDNNWIGFCQKRRFWIKKESLGKKINLSNFNDHFLFNTPREWENFDAIVCDPISVHSVKKIKLIKRGFKSILKDPSILLNKNKQTIALHFDMHHGYGNINKAIEVMDIEDKSQFKEFVNTSTEFNPHLMFISKPRIINKWFETLFPWLERCEKIFESKNLKGYDTTRIYAYLAERYLSFWFKKNTKVLSWPWVLFDQS